MKTQLLIYDEESLPNIFTFRGKILGDDSGTFKFEISERVNDISKLRRLMGYLIKNGIEMVGFNNLMYDYPLLHAILHLSDEYVTAENINAISNSIINDNSMGGFGVVIWGNQQLVPQWDIYLINHFNNNARRTSLKAIEFWQRSLNVCEFDAPFDEHLDPSKFDDLHEYNGIDVFETEKFVDYCLPMLELREDLMSQSNQDLRWSNNGKIGQAIFLDLLGHDNCYKHVDGVKTPVGTSRDSVALTDTVSVKVMLDDIPEFTAIKNFFHDQVVTETKGAFAVENLEFSDEMLSCMKREFTATDLLRHEALRIYEEDDKPLKAEHYPPRTFQFIKRHHEGKPVNSDYIGGKIKRVNILHDGLEYVFGTGGLHASRHKAVFHETDDETIIDWDFTAYYPSLGRILGICPEQFDPVLWGQVQETIWQRRQSFKKGTAGYAAYKEAGNLPYGNSGFEKSFLYDPKYMLSICVNGQLLLLSLIEMLLTRTDSTIIQANTDGVTFKIPRDQMDECHVIQKEFEEHTDLAIEEAVYKSMHIRDVNNYIATYTDGEVKMKGVYEIDKLPHKDSSMTVVPKAVLANIRDGIEIEDFIHDHDDMFDFFKRVKLNKKGKAFADGEPLHEKLIRYYCSTDGVELTKQTEKSTGRIEANSRCTIAQDVTDMSFPDNINYRYYVEEAYKLLKFQEE